MHENFLELLELHERHLQQIRLLKEVLQKEKKALVEFDSESLWNAQTEKQSALNSLLQCKARKDTFLSLVDLSHRISSETNRSRME